MLSRVLVAVTVLGSTLAAQDDPAAEDDRVAAISRSVSLRDYSFTPPEGWLVHSTPEQILLTQAPDGTGCLIQILPPQASSGDLQKDASAVFDMMYPGWQPQRTGAEQYTLVTGRLPRGLEFCAIEAGMAQTTADGRYHTEDGGALVFRIGQQVGIVAVRHRSLLGHTDCIRNYNTWRRFFNSLHVEQAPLPPAPEADPATRIVGVWSQSGGGAIGEYVFAANGRYALTGGLGSSSTSRDDRYEYLHIRSHAWRGDGSYTIAGAELRLRGRGSRQPERMQLRFEQVNHGGTGWKDRLWLLKTDQHGQSEVCYEKKH